MPPFPPYLHTGPTRSLDDCMGVGTATLTPMTARRKIVVEETIALGSFWVQFRSVCRSRGVPYTVALTKGARLWLDSLHREGVQIPRDMCKEPGSWYPPEDNAR